MIPQVYFNLARQPSTCWAFLFLMKKEAYYFSHDANAKDDPKILQLRMHLGWEGYGLFWGLIELLRNQPDYRMQKHYMSIAFALHAFLIVSSVCMTLVPSEPLRPCCQPTVSLWSVLKGWAPSGFLRRCCQCCI